MFAERAQDQQGVVSVEMALSVPLLMLFFVAVVGLGHALYLRFTLTQSVGEVARACGLHHTSADACEGYARERLQETARWCAPLTVRAETRELPGLDEAEGLLVSASCAYSGGVANAALQRRGIRIAELKVSAMVPY